MKFDITNMHLKIKHHASDDCHPCAKKKRKDAKYLYYVSLENY